MEPKRWPLWLTIISEEFGVFNEPERGAEEIILAKECLEAEKRKEAEWKIEDVDPQKSETGAQPTKN